MIYHERFPSMGTVLHRSSTPNIPPSSNILSFVLLPRVLFTKALQELIHISECNFVNPFQPHHESWSLLPTTGLELALPGSHLIKSTKKKLRKVSIPDKVQPAMDYFRHPPHFWAYNNLLEWRAINI
jgi:hypothetical protein